MDQKFRIKLEAVDRTKAAFNKLESRTAKVKKALFSLRGALVGIGAGVAIRSIINVTSNFEDLRDSLTSVTGSAKAGAEAFRFIQDFALRSQFSVEDLTTSFITLKASGIQPTEKLLRVFTDTASVTTDQLGTLEALTRVFSRGVQGGLGLEELNQIADRGVPIFKLLEEEIGLSRLEISKFGQTTEGAKKILDALEKSLGRTFAGNTAQKLDNLSVASSNLGIAFRKFQDIIGSASFGKATALLFDSLSALLEAMSPLGRLIGYIGGLIAKVLTVAVKNTTTTFKFLVTVLTELRDLFIGIVKFALRPFQGIIDKMADVLIGFANIVREKVNIALDKIGDAITYIIDAYNELKRSLGIEPDTKSIDITKDKVDELTKAINEYKKAYEASFTGQLTIQAQESLDKMKTTFENINQILAGAILQGIDAMSKALAESIILGKDLGKAFKQFILNGIVSAVAGLIKYFATKLLILALEKLFPNLLKNQVDLETAKLDVLKKQTKELQKQAALRVLLMFLGAAEGGQVRGNKADGGQVTGYRQAGGGVTQTGAYIVGERGRELFVPNQDGEIVSNERLQQLGTNVNFTINATDVKGVKELLIDNRAVIVNIINGALNQKGKAALV